MASTDTATDSQQRLKVSDGATVIFPNRRQDWLPSNTSLIAGKEPVKYRERYPVIYLFLLSITYYYDVLSLSWLPLLDPPSPSREGERYSRSSVESLSGF